MKPSLVLRKAAALVEKGWCKGAYARDSAGRSIDLDEYPDDPDARRFCALGALMRTSGRVGTYKALIHVDKAVDLTNGGLVYVNDYHAGSAGHVACVLALAACLAEDAGE